MRVTIHTVDSDRVRLNDAHEDEVDMIVDALRDASEVIQLNLGPDKITTHIRVGAIVRVDID